MEQYPQVLTSWGGDKEIGQMPVGDGRKKDKFLALGIIRNKILLKN